MVLFIVRALFPSDLVSSPLPECSSFLATLRVFTLLPLFPASPLPLFNLPHHFRAPSPEPRAPSPESFPSPSRPESMASSSLSHLRQRLQVPGAPGPEISHAQALLTNPDLVPVEPERREWKAWNFAAFWIADSVNINTWMIASTAIVGGLSWYVPFSFSFVLMLFNPAGPDW